MHREHGAERRTPAHTAEETHASLPNFTATRGKRTSAGFPFFLYHCHLVNVYLPITEAASASFPELTPPDAPQCCMTLCLHLTCGNGVKFPATPSPTHPHW